MNMPKFSVIIPVYNVAPYLRECLDSVRAQTFAGWEAVCVDDGSTDASGAILDEYAAKDPRFRVLHQPNAGVSAARNAGLRMATGEVVNFLDGDDFVASGLLEEVSRLFEKERPDLVRTQFCRNRDAMSDEPSDTAYQVLDGEAKVATWAARELPETGYSCLLFVRRSCVKEVFPEGVRFAEDVLFTMGVARHCSRVVQSRYRGYFYRNRPGSAIGQRLSSEERVRFFRKFREVAEAYRGCGGKLSIEAWINLSTWIFRPQDTTFRKEVHAAFSELVESGLVDPAEFPSYLRLSCRIYVLTGLLWPVRLVYFLAHKAIRLRDSFKTRREVRP